MTADADTDGASVVLVCDGSTWNAVAGGAGGDAQFATVQPTEYRRSTGNDFAGVSASESWDFSTGTASPEIGDFNMGNGYDFQDDICAMRYSEPVLFSRLSAWHDASPAHVYTSLDGTSWTRQIAIPSAFPQDIVLFGQYIGIASDGAATCNEFIPVAYEVSGGGGGGSLTWPLEASTSGALGDEAAPQYTISGDTDSGLFGGGGDVGLTVNGSSVFYSLPAGGTYLNDLDGTGLYLDSNQQSGNTLFISDSGGFEFILSGGSAWPLTIDTSSNVLIDGSVGINDSNPSVALDVVGDINYTGVLVDVSDIRMKYDIEPLQRPLAKLTALNGFSFKMKDDESENIEYGISAQDVQKVFPELVHQVDDSGTLGVSYNGLIAPMIEAMKEQQAQIEALQAEIETLKMQNEVR